MAQDITINYRNADLRGYSFQGQDLTGINFSHADIRGAKFTDANLAGADLSYARAGVSVQWIWVIITASLLISYIGGMILGWASTVPAFVVDLPAEEFDGILRGVVLVLGVAVLAATFAILLFRGLTAALTLFAVVTATTVLFLATPMMPIEIPLLTTVLGLGIGAPLAVVIGIATVIAIWTNMDNRRFIMAALAIATGAAALGMWEGTMESGPEVQELTGYTLVTSLFIAGISVAIHLAASIYIARNALAGDKKFDLIQKLVIMLLSSGGTSFRNANLTDATFAHASLEHSDFRDSTLIRTDWIGAKNLQRARVDRTFLMQLSLLQLAVSKQGRGQNYDHLDLNGLNLKDANLKGASLIGTNLSEATLENADLTSAILAQSQLHNANLRGAKLTGAYIDNWGISTNTCLDDIQCEYIYMRLPTPGDPDPMRKPDNNHEYFQAGDFADFIAPFIRTLDLYSQQFADPRKLGRAIKTVDLVRYGDVDPTISAISLRQLAEKNPAAELQVVALEGKGKEKLRFQAVVSNLTDRSTLSSEYDTIYKKIESLPKEDVEALFANMVHKDKRIRQLERILMASTQSDAFYMKANIMFGTIVKCVFFAANPLNTQRLSLDVEIREITEKIRLSEYRNVLELIPVMAVRRDDLLQALNVHRPQIVHFSGHGMQTGEIMLVDDQGVPVPVSAQTLKALFSVMKDNIRLVILNACYAETQAKAITEVIDCAVGMSDVISDQAAITFIASFYRALGFGRSIQDAFDQGIVALKLENFPEEATPKLLSRNGVDPARIVLVAPE